METRHEDLKREMPSKCKKEWDDDPKIRQEFGTLESYTAWRIAEKSGSTSITPDPNRTKDKPFPLKYDPTHPVKRASVTMPVNADDLKGELAERCIAQWKADPAIRHEFGTVGAYFAFCSNETNPTERS